MKMSDAIARVIGGFAPTIAREIGSPFSTAMAMKICRSSPQNTVFHRIACLLFDNAHAIARINTNPISAEKRSICVPFGVRDELKPCSRAAGGASTRKDECVYFAAMIQKIDAAVSYVCSRSKLQPR